jgi:hypothetical protein
MKKRLFPTIHCLGTLEAISKMQTPFKDKRHTLINTIRCVIPPRRGRGPIRRRFKSYGGTREKAQSRQRRDEQYILRRSAIRQSTLADNWALVRQRSLADKMYFCDSF